MAIPPSSSSSSSSSPSPSFNLSDSSGLRESSDRAHEPLRSPIEASETDTLAASPPPSEPRSIESPPSEPTQNEPSNSNKPSSKPSNEPLNERSSIEPPLTDRLQDEPKPRRARFIPIATPEATEPQTRPTSRPKSEERVIVLPEGLGAIEPTLASPDASLSSSGDNPFNADLLDWGEPATKPQRQPIANSRADSLADSFAEPAAEPVSEPATGSDKSLATDEPTIDLEGWTWRNAGRAERWTRQKSPRSGRLRRRELIAAIVLYALTSIGLHWLMQRSNDVLLTLGLRPIQAFYLNHNLSLAIAFGMLAIAAPWLLDVLLQRRHHAQPLTQRRLAQHSPEAAQILTRFAQPKHRAKPTLYSVKTPAALVWVYGYGQKSLRLVISSGAIETLTAEEIAIEVAAGLAAAVQGDVLFATVSMALLQVPYVLYDGLTTIGNHCQTWTQRDRPATLGFDRVSVRVVAAEIGLWITATIATFAYGVYRLWRLPLLAWSRLRQTYADHFAANLTGNPNARVRSLVKQALTQHQDFEQNRGLSSLCERFELWSAVNPRHGLWCGADPFHPPMTRLRWDAITPYSTWLAIGDGHPALGQRLVTLLQLAQRFELEPELSPEIFRHPPHLSRRPRTPRRNLPITPKSLLESADLMQNLTPLLGVVAAISLVGLAASLGAIGRLFEWQSLSWLQADWPWLALGLGLEGFAIGTVLRINAFFPDFKPYALKASPDLERWITDPDSVPIDSRTLRLSGRLVGRCGVGNWFGQDLWLDDGSTLWPLHYLDRTGWLGWLVPTYDRVNRQIGKRVTITGWFRRGVTPWIDVDRLEPLEPPTDATSNPPQSKPIPAPPPITTPQNGHPLWSTAIASLCAVWGAVILARGGL